MRRRIRNARRIQPSHRKHPANNRILVALRQIRDADSHVVEKQARIGVVLARIGEFAFRQRGLDPLRFYDGDQGVADRVVAWEVDGGGDDVGEFVEGGQRGWGDVNEGFSSVLADCI